MEECIFCKIIKGEIPSYKIYEDDDVVAFLDHTPVSDGHTLVIPKKHYNNLLELPQGLADKVLAVVKKIVPAIVSGVEAGGFNLNLNNGKVAGQVVDHAHFHIVPRFEDDGLKLWPQKEYEEGKADSIINKIKTHL